MVDYTRDHLPEYDIGEYTYGIPQVIGNGKVTIGKFCSIAIGVQLIVGGDHNIDHIASYPFDNIPEWGMGVPLTVYNRPNEIRIGNDVWLGTCCRILHGVEIGDGAVVGAFAVVAKDVRPYAVVVGNPAREIRRRFPDEVIERLLEIKWWDWPESKIRENLDILTWRIG